MIQYDLVEMLASISERIRGTGDIEFTEYERAQFHAAAEILSNIATRVDRSAEDRFPSPLRAALLAALRESDAPHQLRQRAERCFGMELSETSRTAQIDAGGILADAAAWATQSDDQHVRAAAISLIHAELDFEVTALTR